MNRSRFSSTNRRTNILKLKNKLQAVFCYCSNKINKVLELIFSSNAKKHWNFVYYSEMKHAEHSYIERFQFFRVDRGVICNGTSHLIIVILIIFSVRVTGLRHRRLRNIQLPVQDWNVYIRIMCRIAGCLTSRLSSLARRFRLFTVSALAHRSSLPLEFTQPLTKPAGTDTVMTPLTFPSFGDDTGEFASLRRVGGDDASRVMSSFGSTIL